VPVVGLERDLLHLVVGDFDATFVPGVAVGGLHGESTGGSRLKARSREARWSFTLWGLDLWLIRVLAVVVDMLN